MYSFDGALKGKLEGGGGGVMQNFSEIIKKPPPPPPLLIKNERPLVYQNWIVYLQRIQCKDICPKIKKNLLVELRTFSGSAKSYLFLYKWVVYLRRIQNKEDLPNNWKKMYDLN